MSEMLSFSLERKSVPVVLENEDTKQPETFAIVELSGKARDDYMNVMGRKTKTTKDGSTTIQNFEGIMSSLLARSLFPCTHKKTPDGILCESISDAPVPEARIQNWPSSVQKALFEVAKEISGLDTEEEDDEEGNV